jgi:hypothetical protein
MSIFGLSWIFKKQNILGPDLTTPTEFINYARTFPEYQALCAVTDQESSDLSALSIYEMAVRARAGAGATLPAANFKPELLAGNLRNLLPLEMNIVARAKTDIDELLLDCFTNVGAARRFGQGLIILSKSILMALLRKKVTLLKRPNILPALRTQFRQRKPLRNKCLL